MGRQLIKTITKRLWGPSFFRDGVILVSTSKKIIYNVSFTQIDSTRWKIRIPNKIAGITGTNITRITYPPCEWRSTNSASRNTLTWRIDGDYIEMTFVYPYDIEHPTVWEVSDPTGPWIGETGTLTAGIIRIWEGGTETWNVYTALPNIDVYFDIYANSDYNDYQHIGLINRLDVVCRPVDILIRPGYIARVPELPSQIYYNVSTEMRIGTYEFYVDKLPANRNMLEEAMVILKSEVVDLSDVLSDPMTPHHTDFTLLRSNSPTGAPSPTGEYLWAIATTETFEDYESCTFECKVNGSSVTPYGYGIYRIPLEPETLYNVDVTTVYTYHGVTFRNDTKTKNYSTTTALMYMDNSGNIGINTMPEDNSLTCSVLNLYEPGYIDAEYPLFSMREAPLEDGTYHHHTLLFKPTAPIVETGSTVKLTGTFTLIQWLRNMPTHVMEDLSMHKPTVMCTCSSGILWNIPQTAAWNVTTFPMATTNLRGLLAYTIRAEWTVTTTVTIDTNKQGVDAGHYILTYWDPSTWYIDGYTMTYDAGSWWQSSTTTGTMAEGGLKYNTVVEGMSGFPIEQYQIKDGSHDRPYEGLNLSQSDIPDEYTWEKLEDSVLSSRGLQNKS